MVRRLDVPWMTKDGYIDLKKIPLDSVLKQAISKDNKEFHGACSVLRTVHMEGREEAGIYLYGLFVQNAGDMARKEIIVKLLGDIKTREAANIMFEELKNIVSSNTTRGYINEILHNLEKYPIELIREGFESLLKDQKWSFKMKGKFEEIIFRKRFSTV